MGKKWTALIAAIIMVLTVGCGQQAQKDNTNNEKLALTIGLMPDLDSVPFIVAREKGYFKDEGVEVDIQSFKSAMDRDAALQSGQLDGAVSDLLAAAFALEGNFDVRVTSMTDGSYQLVAGKGNPFSDVRSMKGAEVAVSRNTIIEYVTDRILEENGMTSEDIQKISVPQIPVRLEMLQNGKLPAATLPEPLASVAMANGCKCVTGSDKMGINPGIMLFSVKTIQEKKNALKAMYRAYNRAVEYLHNTPREEYIDLVVKKGGFPEISKDVLKLPEYQKATLPKDKDFSEVMQWLRAKELVKKDYSYDAVVTGECLP